MLLNPISVKPRNIGKVLLDTANTTSPIASKRTATAVSFESPRWSCKTPPIRAATSDTRPENPKASPAMEVENPKEKCKYSKIKGATAPYESAWTKADRRINLCSVASVCGGLR